MFEVINRRFEPISLRPVGNRLELRIHGEGGSGKGDRWTLLTASEARTLAYHLLLRAEQASEPQKKVAASA